MKTTEMREIYRDVTGFYKQDPDEFDYQLWRNALGNYEKADVMRAFMKWTSDDTQVEAFGDFRAKGSFMPKPADIKAIMESGKRKALESEAKKFRSCERTFPDGWRCSGGSLMMLLENPRRVRFGAQCDCWKAWKGVDVDRKSIGAGL